MSNQKGVHALTAEHDQSSMAAMEEPQEDAGLVTLPRQTIDAMRARIGQLAALNALGELMNRTPDLDSILYTALDSAVELVGMDAGGILLLDPSGRGLVLRAHVGASQALTRTAKGSTVDQGLMPRFMESLIIVDDFSSLPEQRRTAMQAEGFRALVGMPLQSRESPVGVMFLASRSPRHLADDESELLSALGNQIGLAVECSRLRDQELRAAVLEERHAISRQMHDDIAQDLAALGMKVDELIGSPGPGELSDMLSKLEAIRVAISNAYNCVRDLISRLLEDAPVHRDLRDSLQEAAAEFEQRAGYGVATEMAEDRPLHLSPLVATQAACIVREALTNAWKHAAADRVRLTLRDQDRAIEITVEDNGCGFRFHATDLSGHSHYGLRFMRERAQGIGGHLTIESQPGQGTRIVIHLPSS